MRRFLVLGLGLLLASAVQAQTLGEKVRWNKIKEEAKELNADFQQACGVALNLQFDMGSFKGWDLENGRVLDRCRSTVERIQEACTSSPEGKKAVQAQVKSVTCGGRADSTPERYSLSGGNFTFSVAANQANGNDRDWLKKSLGGGLKDAEIWAEATRLMSEPVAAFNSKCETSLAMEFDKPSFKGRNPDNQLVPRHCDRPVYTLREWCGDEGRRKRLVKQVKKVVCKAVAHKDSAFASVKGGVLVYEMGLEGGHIPADEIKQLETILK